MADCTEVLLSPVSKPHEFHPGASQPLQVGCRSSPAGGEGACKDPVTLPFAEVPGPTGYNRALLGVLAVDFPGLPKDPRTWFKQRVISTSLQAES